MTMNVLLINSEKPRTGKSTYVQHLQQTHTGIKHLSFAGPIKNLSIQFADALYTNLPSMEHNPIDYHTSTKDKPIGGIFEDNTPRELVCDVSDLYSKFTNPNIWGMVAYENICRAKEEGFEYCIFDDWRRFKESKYLQDKQDLKVTTLYLSKSDIEFTPTSGSVASFEGNISANDCDLAFEFTSNWDNTPELDSVLSTYLGLKYNHG